MFVLYALYPTPFSPQAPCHPRGQTSTPWLCPHPKCQLTALLLLSFAMRVSVPPTLQRPRSVPTPPCKKKQNRTEKRQNGPTLHFPVKALDRTKPRTPEECLVEDTDGWDNKSSCCITVQLHFGPRLSICYSETTQSLPIPMRVMFSNVTDNIKCCILSACGAWRVSEELPNKGNTNRHSIRY